jgi:alcohol dehydrogenase class IV
VETFYHPYATEVPWKGLAGWALGTLFENLPKCCHQQSDEDNDDVLTKLLLAAYASSGFRGANFRGGMGLSHSLGHAMGSPYGIPRELPEMIR